MHKKFAKSSLPGASCPKPPKSNTKNCFCKKQRLILIHYLFQSLSQAKVIFKKKGQIIIEFVTIWKKILWRLSGSQN
jgi:hypothetical protein